MPICLASKLQQLLSQGFRKADPGILKDKQTYRRTLIPPALGLLPTSFGTAEHTRYTGQCATVVAKHNQF